ncbi:MAG: GNAT family N-acetyltransferase [Hyphomonadaceae bacterium]
MLSISEAPILTERLTLMPLRVEHAGALFDVLGDAALYQWIARDPPASLEALSARFLRIAQRTSPERRDQWLNWTVWTRPDHAIGIVEATVSPDRSVLIAYMFSSSVWGQGFASEAVRATMNAMINAGAPCFDAVIDTRNAASIALVRRLGYVLVETRASDDLIGGAPSEEQVWRFNVANIA